MSRNILPTPCYLPDATQGVVRSLAPSELAAVGTQAVVVNTYHLLLNVGMETLTEVGGVGKFMHFDGTIVSDSGGFQIMSLIHHQKTWGKITPEGLWFKWRRRGRDEKILFTPELSIAAQFAIGSDVIVAFDYFTNPDGTRIEQERSVELTSEWASRSKAEFTRQVKQRQMTEASRPQLMGVIQGGRDFKLREQSAKELLKMGFDLFGYGGWPLNSEGKFDYELFQFNASLTPKHPRFALGVGKPEDIVAGYSYGYSYFDCVLPTRDARHGRLYVFNEPISQLNLSEPFYHYLYLDSEKFRTDFTPIDPHCQCPTCQSFSRGYLYHLFKVKESLAWRLATTHNLYFYNQLISRLNND